MSAIANGWNPPSSSGIAVPVKVAKDFTQADARKQQAAAQQLRKK